MSTVMVTGGLGVIGSLVLRKLLERKVEVVSFDLQEDRTLISDIAAQVNIVQGDILDVPNIVQTIKHYHVDRIIHTAALMPNDCEANPLLGFKVNSEGTVNVLEAARQTGIKRVVYCSTMSVYDVALGEHAYPTYKPITEDYPKNPWGVYGGTKLVGEYVGTAYGRNYGFEFITLRFGFTYSLGKLARHGKLAIINRMIENAMLGAPTVIDKGGDEKTDMTYNGDTANALVLACCAKNLKEKIYHIGTGKVSGLRDAAAIIKKIYPEAKIEIGPGLDLLGIGVPRYYAFDISRATKELGYVPQYDLEAGVKDYIRLMKVLNIQPTAT